MDKEYICPKCSNQAQKVHNDYYDMDIRYKCNICGCESDIESEFLVKEFSEELHTPPALYTSNDKQIGVEVIGHMIRVPHKEASRKWREFTGRIFTLVQKIPYKSETDLAPENIKKLMKNPDNIIHWDPEMLEPYEYELKMEIPIEMSTKENE